MLRIAQFQPLQHQELVMLTCLPRLVGSSGRTRNHQIPRQESLELNGISAGLPSSIAQAQGQGGVTVVVDAGLCDHGDAHGIHQTVQPPSITRL